MKIFNKNLYGAGLVLAAVLVFSFVQVGCVSASEKRVQNTAIAVMTEVVGLNMEKYEIELLSNTTDYPGFCGGLVRDSLTYNIEAVGSKAQIVCTFINKTLTRFAMYPLEGSLLYAQPLSPDLLTATKTLLNRIQAYFGASHIQEARNILEKVTEIKTMNVTTENLKLIINEFDDNLSLMWWKTINGIDFPYGLSIKFNNGQLKGFSDDSNLYQIGTADVNVSREDAIRTTKKLSKDHTTLNVSTGNGDYKKMTLNLTDEHTVVELQIGTREPFTYYPLWYVRLYAETSIGGTDGFQAGIWADTGEIAYSQLTSHHGVIPLEDASNQVPTQSQNSSDPNLITYLFVGLFVTTTAATILLIRKKRSK